MRKIFLVVTLLYIISNIAFASPHENGIDDFYFGQPIEEIRAQYELTNEKYNEKDGTVEYEVQVPSLDFYGINIEQPITLEFKDNKLCGISFGTVSTTAAESSKLYKKVVEFASVQYGRPLSDDFMSMWFTGKISMSITNLDLTETLSSIDTSHKNYAHLFIIMDEKYMEPEVLNVFKQRVASQK